MINFLDRPSTRRAGDSKASSPSRTRTPFFPEQLHFDAVGALTTYLVLLLLVPARWVLPGLGGAGRPANLFGLGLFVLWLIAKWLPDIQRDRTALRWPLLFNGCALLMSYGLGYGRGLSPVEALASDRAVLDLIALTGVILVAAEGLPTIDRVECLTKRLTYLTAVVIVVGLIQFFGRFDPYSLINFPGLVLNNDIAPLNARGSASLVRARGSTLHAIEFAVMAAMVLPIAVHHALHERNLTVRRIRYLIVVLHGFGALLAVSRSAIVALAVVFAVLFWAWSPVMRLKSMFVGLVAMVVFRSAVSGLLGTILSLFTNWGQDPSVEGRTEDYDDVFEFVQQRPWWGRGPGTFVPTEYFFLDNAFLLRLLETGIIGLIALLGLSFTAIVSLGRAILNRTDPGQRHLSVAFLALLLVSLVTSGTFDFYSFPTAAGLAYLGIGISPALARPFIGDVPTSRYAPAGLMRPGLQAPRVRRAWWHRFDREMRIRAGRDPNILAGISPPGVDWAVLVKSVKKRLNGSPVRAGRDQASSDEPSNGQTVSDPTADSKPEPQPQSLMSSARWSAIGLVMKQVFRIGFTIVLAGLITPDSFGVVGQAGIYLALSAVFLELGVGAALIQREEITEDDTGTAAAMTLLMGIGIALVSVAAAPLMANFFSTPELTWVVRILAITFVFNGVAVVPSALLIRQLAFKRQSTAEIVSTAAGGICGVVAAVSGAEYWALVVQILVRDGVNAVMLLFLSGPVRLRWSTESMRAISSFGYRVLGAQLLGFARGNSDNILIGRYLGTAALGFYALSYRVLLLPVQILSQTIMRVLFPTLSRLNEDRTQAVNLLLRTIRTLSILVAPIMVLVALNAPRAVPWAFGPEWTPAVLPLQILACGSYLQATGAVTGTMVLATGRARFAVRWEFTATVIMVIGFAFGLQWGVAGVAWSYIVVGTPLYVVYLFLISRFLGFSLRQYAAAVAPALVGLLGLIAAWWSIDRVIGSALPVFWALVMLTLGAAVGYLTVLRVFFPAVARDQLRVVGEIAGRKSATSV